MVFFNYATMQMAAKIVYYGPGLCGKTTNLHHIYTKTSPGSRGEMVSLETETDRTLFFDLLPIDVGVIGGFKTRLQLYTVPGQVFYNTTRKLVLKGVDGIVFVADSQLPMLDANVDSLRNLRENLSEIGVNLDELPLVLQLNKRDLPNVASVDQMLEAMDPERRLDYVEAVARDGAGVFETLKQISKLTLRTLRRRMTGDEPSRSSPAARSGSRFTVREDTAPIRAMPAAPPVQIEEPPETRPEEHFDPEGTIAAASIDRHILSSAPVAELRETQPDLAAEPEIEAHPEQLAAAAPARAEDEIAAAVAEELEADETHEIATQPAEAAAAPQDSQVQPSPEPEPEAPAAPPEVKTVKVRSSVDVMSELENLRKRATQTTPRAPRRDILADLESLRPKRDIHRTLHMQLPADALPRARTVRVTLSVEDEDAGVIETREQQLELGDTSDVQSLSVNLKVDLT
jgi:signal recognition particle receptor subunit beta